MTRKKLTIAIIAITALLEVVIIATNRNISITSLEELGQSLGIVTLLPTLLAVELAFVTKNVLLSLLVGFLSGVTMLGIVYSTSIVDVPIKVLSYLISSIKDVVFDIDNIEILLLCFAVGGMIEVLRSSGGFEALAIKLSKRINTIKKANLVASILGCFILFDDYANTLIVGPIMKPITDRVKVSREKLAFIVDSTAAPVSGIAIISSWIAVEVASINKGLEFVGSNVNDFKLFINSIPFSFYCIFAITFLFINALIGRDFGPMLKAEIRARNGEVLSKESKLVDEDSKIEHVRNKMNKKIFVAIGSIVILVLCTLISFYIDGRSKAIDTTNFLNIISYADTVNLITIAAFVGTIFAIIFGYIFKLFTIKDSIKSWFIGAYKICDTVLMLLIAWCLSNTVENLGTTYFVVEIISNNVNQILVPILIFVCCCLVSCSSGSFGCMFVVMPLAIPLAYEIISMGTIANEQTYLMICVGSVIAGSIFGDHCSPVTDCTLLSAESTGCSAMEHCNSQLPYAIMNGIISIVCGIVLTSLGVNVVISLLIGIIFQVLILLIIGRKPI